MAKYGTLGMLGRQLSLFTSPWAGRKQGAVCDAVQNAARRKREPVSQRGERSHQGLHRDRLCDGEGQHVLAISHVTPAWGDELTPLG